MGDFTTREEILFQLFNSDEYRKLLEFDKAKYVRDIEKENTKLKSRILSLENELKELKKLHESSSEKVWCVYKHVNKVNGKVYIGITSEEVLNDRWDNGNGYKNNKQMYSDITKYGWIDGFYHIVLADNLSKIEAQNMEADLIKKYSSNDKNFGYNLAPGGAIHSVNAIPVCQYDLYNNLIAEYCSISEAARQTGIGDWMIRKCLRGLICSINGFKWKYKNEDIQCNVDTTNITDGEIGRRNDAVYQYSLNGHYIRKYDNSTEASKATGIRSGYITRSCRSKCGRAGNYQWFYEYKGEKIDEYVSCDIAKRKKTPILLYDKDMNFIKKYDTIPQAVEDLTRKLGRKISRTAIYGCLKGRNKTAYGFIFKYADKTN